MSLLEVNKPGLGLPPSRTETAQVFREIYSDGTEVDMAIVADNEFSFSRHAQKSHRFFVKGGLEFAVFYKCAHFCRH